MRLNDAWLQCQRHRHHLEHALTALRPLLPVSATQLALYDDEAVQDWDQFLLRFTKLQDTMGARLLPAVLEVLQEALEDRPMIDKLNRLEKLGLIEHAHDWAQLRAIRNQLAHDYPQDEAIKAAWLNRAVAAVAVLDATLARLRPICETHETHTSPPHWRTMHP
ncbi:MAG: TM1812 family CRISPR-associated protein [Clostridia bacterium]|nr:TM1812 family CRISPR-associated protein [Clostridia bacterium]